MAPELGGSQISALLESVPGIASVLRSPVADALVNMIRAAARVGDFWWDDAQELVQFAVRRGLISADEGDELLAEVKATGRARRSHRSKTGTRRTGRQPQRVGKAAAARRLPARARKKAKKAKKAKRSKRASRATGARRTKQRAKRR